MKIELSLFGAFREFDPAATLSLHLPDGANVANLRAALLDHAQAHWPGFRPGLLAVSVFANSQSVLRDGEPLPADGQMAVLPPVCGG